MSNEKRCYVCGKAVSGDGRKTLNHRTGNVWHSHDGCHGPVPDSYAATAQIMMSLYPDEDWDEWKEAMKEWE